MPDGEDVSVSDIETIRDRLEHSIALVTSNEHASYADAIRALDRVAASQAREEELRTALERIGNSLENGADLDHVKNIARVALAPSIAEPKRCPTCRKIRGEGRGMVGGYPGAKPCPDRFHAETHEKNEEEAPCGCWGLVHKGPPNACPNWVLPI